MTNKRIKNEQWSVKTLISKIDNNDITKPQFQRKKKWDTLPKKNNTSTPNECDYINFLFKTSPIIGNRLFALPLGFSPKIPNSFAPTGLKYLKLAIRHSGDSYL